MSIDRARMRFILIPCLLILFLTVVACGGGSKSKEPSRWDKTSTPSSSSGSSGSSSQAKGKPVDGSKFNRYFPKGGSGYDVTYNQEKKGFAQANLKQKGKSLANLSVTDTIDKPSVAKEYESSSRKIGGYPARDVGSMGTSVLVANRFQVQVRSSDKSFTKQNREEWLQKFNLSGLESVK